MADQQTFPRYPRSGQVQRRMGLPLNVPSWRLHRVREGELTEISKGCRPGVVARDRPEVRLTGNPIEYRRARFGLEACLIFRLRHA